MMFSRDMVHILPGYPKLSPDDPKVAMLAFYVRFHQGLSKTTVVIKKDVLMDIVKSDLSRIEESMDGTIISVKPMVSSPDKLQNANEDLRSDGLSQNTMLIVGASIGGAVFVAIITALLVGLYKRRNR